MLEHFGYWSAFALCVLSTISNLHSLIVRDLKPFSRAVSVALAIPCGASLWWLWIH